MVQGNHLQNCSIHPHNIEIAHKIWGPNVAIPKGKTTRSSTPPLPVVADFIKVPQAILDLHREVTILADIFLVNQIPFFLTVSHTIRFTTVMHLSDRKVFPTGKWRQFLRRITSGSRNSQFLFSRSIFIAILLCHFFACNRLKKIHQHA
jgi:hypothetical protein